MNSIRLTTQIRQNKKLVSSEMDGEIVMMHTETGKYFGLNSVGSTIWTLIDAPRSVQSIVEVLHNRYEVSREQCENEVFSFIESMIKKDVVHVVDPASE